MNAHGNQDRSQPREHGADGHASAASMSEPGVDHADILIGRMLDDEATSDDCEHFERMAHQHPSLWKALALRQQDMMRLSRTMDERTRTADDVELPGTRRGDVNRKLSALLTLSGWAALIVVAALWMTTAQSDRMFDASANRVAVAPPVDMTADDHFAAYLQAGRDSGQVINQLPPTLLEQIELPDGRLRLRIMRRVEESLIVDPDQQPETDQYGNLMTDPSKLRTPSPGESMPQ
jgi:hypothetical protein